MKFNHVRKSIFVRFVYVVKERHITHYCFGRIQKCIISKIILSKFFNCFTMSFPLNAFKLGTVIKQIKRNISITNCLRVIFHDKARKRFLFYIEYGKNAEIHYRLRPDVINVIDLHHSYVPVKFRNQGIGYIMAEEVFEYLSEANVKVSLTCPFLIDFYLNNPEIKHIIYKPETYENRH